MFKIKKNNKEKNIEIKENKSSKKINFNIRKFKNKKILIVVGIIVIVLIIIGVYKYMEYRHDESIKAKSSIDFSSETYKGKEITVEGNKVIIKEENGSETIEIVGDNDSMTEATDEIKNLFTVTVKKVEKKTAKTVVTGNVVSDTSKYDKVVVTATFKRNGEIAGVSSAILEDIKKSEAKSFEITLLGDYIDCTYDVDIEYVD